MIEKVPMDQKFPIVADLLPQKEPMIFIDRVEDWGDDYVECSVTAGRVKGPEDESGNVVVWVGLEYMAQTLGAFTGLQAFSLQEPIRTGVILGSRKLECFTSSFEKGRALRVCARSISDDGNVGIFACCVMDTLSRAVLLKGQLSVYTPKNFVERRIK